MEPIDENQLSPLLRKWEVDAAPPSLEARVFRIERRVSLWRRWGPVLAIPVTAAFALLVWTLHLRERVPPPASAPPVQVSVPPPPVVEAPKASTSNQLPPGATKPQTLQVDSGPTAGKLLEAPKPVLPPDAQAAGLQGVVKLRIRIGKDGHVIEATVISGHPMLADAAIEAVKQWLYQPTLLNGEAIEVVTEIDVTFTRK